MKNGAYLIITVAVGTVVTMAILGLNLITPSGSQVQLEDRIVVATTIFPLTDIANQVGGDKVKVVQLLPAGSSPHNYNLTVQQLVQVSDADTLFMIGHGFDDWAAQAVAEVGDFPIIVVDQDITLLPFDNTQPENKDPHYWLMIPNAQQIARNMAELLMKIDAGNADQYRQNLSQYLDHLEVVERELQDIADGLEQKNIMTIHNAWSYFAGQYGLEIVATYESREGGQPTFSDLKSWKQLLKENNISVFYTEPQREKSGATDVLSEQFGLVTKILDPLGGTQEDDSYVKLMRRNIQALVLE